MGARMTPFFWGRVGQALTAGPGAAGGSRGPFTRAAGKTWDNSGPCQPTAYACRTESLCTLQACHLATATV